ncbi:DUF4349 domain-containing protein [Natronospora cellulosivora (SeqCode)]
MNHKKIKNLLPLYIDKGLDDKEMKLIKNHLNECPECKNELIKYKNNYNFLSSLEEIQAPKDFVKKIKKKSGVSMNMKNKKKDVIYKVKDFLSKPLPIPSGIVGIAVIILFIFIIGSPSNLFNEQRSKEQEDLANIRTEVQNFTTFQSNNDLSQSLVKESNMMTRSLALESKNIADNANNINPENQRKLIHRANLTIEVKNIEEINELVLNIAERHNGYIANTNDWVNNNDQKFSRYQLRIPADNFKQVLHEISNEELGTVLNRSISGQDVTEEYMDIEIRLKNLEIQQERYRDLFERASTVEELLNIENELNRTRTEIERLKGRINYLDNQINYSTITVEYQEQAALSSGKPGIIRTLRNAVQEAIYQVYKMIILAGTILPYLLLGLFSYLIYRMKRNK